MTAECSSSTSAKICKMFKDILQIPAPSQNGDITGLVTAAIEACHYLHRKPILENDAKTIATIIIATHDYLHRKPK